MLIYLWIFLESIVNIKTNKNYRSILNIKTNRNIGISLE